MHKLKSYLAVLAFCLFATTAPPAQAASTVDGNWSAGECGGFFIHIVDSVAFVILQPKDDSWSVVPAGKLSGATVTGDSFSFSGGQTIGGTYKAPTGSAAGPGIEINFSGLAPYIRPRPGVECQITQTEFFTGGLIAGAVYNAPWTGPYVTHQRAADNTFGPDELGTGYTVQMQGSILQLGVAGYDAAGKPLALYLRGACTMTENYICLLQGTLLHQDGTPSAYSVSYQLRNNGGAVLLFNGAALQPEPQTWLARYKFDRQ